MPPALALLTTAFALTFAATAQAWIPNDPGISGAGWQADQWNFLPGTGVDAPRAWDNLFAAGQARRQGREDRRARQRRRVRQPRALQEVAGPQGDPLRQGLRLLRARGQRRDACEGSDAHPNDDYGHGTHVVEHDRRDAEQRPRPDRPRLRRDDHPGQGAQPHGDGDEETIAEGIRFAVKRGAQIINLSFEFGSRTTSRVADPADRRRRPVRALQGRRDRRRCREHGAQPRRATRPRCRAWSASARSPSTAAPPTTPTPARAWTSSRPAAARTRRCPTSRTACRTARSAARSTSSRSRARSSRRSATRPTTSGRAWPRRTSRPPRR